MTHHTRRHAFVLLAPAALVFAACSADTSSPPPDAEPVRATVDTAALTEVVERVDVGGTVRARTVAVLSSRIVAPVLAVHVQAGDRVRAGEPLVVLDARDLAASRTRAIAAVSAAEEAGVAAGADESAARATLVLARISHDRIAALRGRNSATAAELDEATAALRAAEARVAAARARAEERARGLEAARADVAVASITAGYGSITAPFDGIVALRSVDPGVMASPGVPLLTLEDDRTYRLEISVDASRVAGLAAGARVPVTAGAANVESEGVVAEIARAVHPAVHSTLVKIDLPPIEGLRSGMFGRARLTGPSRRALTVPESAVVRRGQLTLVFVESGGVARMRVVHAGAAYAGRTEIVAGLSEREAVVVNPPPDLADGRAIATPAGGSR